MAPDVEQAPYHNLAAIYDQWQASYGVEYAEAIVPRVVRTLHSAEIPKGSVLDLGCGTGTLAIALQERGWSALGVDRCSGMIKAAQEKAAHVSHPPTFAVADVRTLKYRAMFSVVVCVYDVINHLTEAADLRKAFRSVYTSLTDDGLFMFDTNNLRCYRTIWADDDTIVHPGFSLHINNRYSEKSRIAVSDFLVRNVETGEETRETLFERCYLVKEILEALREAGFSDIRHEHFAFPGVPGAGLLKTWWSARKRSLTPSSQRRS